MYTTQERPPHYFREAIGPEREPAVALEAGPPRVVEERTAGSLMVRLLAADEDRQQPTTLALQGELDLVTAPVLLEVLNPVLERGTGPLVINLSGVSFMDSTGVHVLVDALRCLEAENRRLTISFREHGSVHRLLSLVGLLDAVAVPS
jgi:anti-anti-sigma factor